MSSPWFIVARTELTEGVRSRWFIIMTILGPVLSAGLLALSIGLALQAEGKSVHLALVDHSAPSMADTVKTALEQKGDGKARIDVEIATGDESAMAARVDTGAIDGYLVLPPDAAQGGTFVYRGSDASSPGAMSRISQRLKTAVTGVRARTLGLTGDQVTSLTAAVTLDARQASGSGDSASGDAAFVAAYAASLLLYMGILMYGVRVMGAVVQEKTSRVVEVLVACVRPWDLMIGKVVGVGTLGLLQMSVWGAAALTIAHFRGPVLARFGVSGGEAIALPHLGAGEMAVVLVYFLGGYFLYASMYAAVGAASSSEREAQQAQMPLMMPLIAASMCFQAVTSAPRGTSAVVLTLIPFVSPILMPMRYMLTPIPAWQLALSIALLLATIAVTLTAASRVYRTGILMYGKKPTFAELFRWIRSSG